MLSGMLSGIILGLFGMGACASSKVEILAIQTCEALPTLTIDAIGHALLAPLVDPSEYNRWSNVIEGTVI